VCDSRCSRAAGIADARNIARCALVLIQDHGVVLAPNSQVKDLDGDDAAAGGYGGASASAQASHDDKTERTVCARLALLLAHLPAADAEAAMRRLKVSKPEIKRALQHMRLLGRLPNPTLPGELRRYRAVLGSQLVRLQLKLERAWAQSAAAAGLAPSAAGSAGTVGSETGLGDAAGELEVVEQVGASLAALDPLKGGAEPLVTGAWLMAQGQKPGKVLGRIKEFLYYCQVDQDLGSCQAVERLYAAEKQKWEDMDQRLLDMYLDELPRLQWPPY